MLKLARTAAKNHLSKRELQRVIRAAKKKKGLQSKAGRPRLPAFQKSIHALAKFVDGDVFGDLDKVGSREQAEARGRYETVTAVKLRCEALQKVLAETAGL